MNDLIEGEWYWIKMKGEKDWTPAKRSTFSAGGWTNDDTWEDFDKKVIEWRISPRPLSAEQFRSLQKKARELSGPVCAGIRLD